MAARKKAPLSEAIKQIDRQLEELRPLVQEYERLQEIRKALSSMTEGANEASSILASINHKSTGAPDSPMATITHISTHRRGLQGDKLDHIRQGKVTAAVLDYIEAHPGVTVRQIIENTNRGQYVFDVVRNLHRNGAIVKDGHQVFPATPPQQKAGPAPKRRRSRKNQQKPAAA